MGGFITIFLASVIQGISGFGFALIAVPLLSLFIPEIKTITPIIVIYSLITNIYIAYKSREYIQIKKVAPLVLFGLIGTPFGILLLVTLKVRILKIIIGIIILITALAMLKNYKVKIKNENLSYGVIGILSGVLNGSTGLSGPPVVLFLRNQEAEKDIFRASLSIYGIATNVFAIITFLFGGIIKYNTLIFTVSYLPALFLGVIIGVKVVNWISEALFRVFTVYLIIILGIYTVTINIIK